MSGWVQMFVMGGGGLQMDAVDIETKEKYILDFVREVSFFTFKKK